MDTTKSNVEQVTPPSARNDEELEFDFSDAQGEATSDAQGEATSEKWNTVKIRIENTEPSKQLQEKRQDKDLPRNIHQIKIIILPCLIRMTNMMKKKSWE